MNTPSKPQSRWIKFSALSIILSALLGQSQVHAQTTASSILNPEEVKGLLHMVEEEKLAGDVYQTLYAKTGLLNFKNIVSSERNHQSALQNLLRQYGIADPTTGKGVGEFTQPAFTGLYQKLVNTGAQSHIDALKVGLKIEDLDIDDLQKEMAHTQRADIKRVYDNLTRGSRNHLRSFDRTLRQMGQTYTPEFISQAQYDAIASSAQEKGYGQGCGQGSAQGRGRQNAQDRNQTQRMPQCIN
ncbi:MAG: hypothetical protein H6R05_245 [Burkholderiaceae bacterium]|nr:hypothetical protein [Burkholderiaceae bacterium]